MKLRTKGALSYMNFLVSVKNINEISDELLNEIDILDLKDPSKGSIGSWKNFEIKKVITRFKKRTKISATLGDIFNNKEFKESLERFDNLNLDFVKFGLLSFANENLFEKLRLISLKQFRTKLVCVVFVDHKETFERVNRSIKIFLDAGIEFILLDTFRKDEGNLLDFCNMEDLKEFISKCKHFNIKVGLAGGLKESQVPPLLCLKPNIIGFRSAVCELNKRESLIKLKKVKRISFHFNSFRSNATERAGA